MTPTAIQSDAAAKPGTYAVGRPASACSVCGKSLPPGTKIMAALRETPGGLERLDVDPDCWSGIDQNALLAFWQTSVPEPEAKKKLLVDDAVLCELFERLGDASEPAKLNFRFVLGLILMRKRLLSYQSSSTRDGKEMWVMRLRGKDDNLELLNPHLGEQQVAEVSQQLSEILNETL